MISVLSKKDVLQFPKKHNILNKYTKGARGLMFTKFSGGREIQNLRYR